MSSPQRAGGNDPRRLLPLISKISGERRKRAAKPVSRSQWNVGYGADCGPSRGGSRRGAIRPIEPSKAAIRNGCFRSPARVRLTTSRCLEDRRERSAQPLSRTPDHRPAEPLKSCCFSNKARSDRSKSILTRSPSRGRTTGSCAIRPFAATVWTAKGPPSGPPRGTSLGPGTRWCICGHLHYQRFLRQRAKIAQALGCLDDQSLLRES